MGILRLRSRLRYQSSVSGNCGPGSQPPALFTKRRRFPRVASWSEKAMYLVLVGDINANKNAPASRVLQFIGERHACTLITIRDSHMPALAMQTPGDDLAET